MHDACGSHHRWLLGGLVVRERPGVHQRDCAAQAAGRTGYGLSVRHYGAGGPRPVGRCANSSGVWGWRGVSSLAMMAWPFGMFFWYAESSGWRISEEVKREVS